jgi:hypothetical protein
MERAQRDSAKKTLKFGLDMNIAYKVKKLTRYYIDKSVLIIDCHSHGFGGMGDRFDSILPPNLIVSITCY